MNMNTELYAIDSPTEVGEKGEKNAVWDNRKGFAKHTK